MLLFVNIKNISNQDDELISKYIIVIVIPTLYLIIGSNVRLQFQKKLDEKVHYKIKPIRRNVILNIT